MEGALVASIPLEISSEELIEIIEAYNQYKIYYLGFGSYFMEVDATTDQPPTIVGIDYGNNCSIGIEIIDGTVMARIISH